MYIHWVYRQAETHTHRLTHVHIITYTQTLKTCL